MQLSRLLRFRLEHDGRGCGIIRWMRPFESGAPVKALSRQRRPAGPAFTGAALSNTLDNRMRAAGDLSGSLSSRDQAAGATCCAIAHKNAAISRAIAAMTTGRFLPAALSRR